ncbi:MAG: NADPH-dependent FMN reductase [Prochlorothrix sp.]
MAQPPKLLAFAGSARVASFNKKLVQVAAAAAEAGGAAVTVADLAHYPMPLFNEDLEAEQGLPQSVLQFKDLLKNHDGFLIACPEYNGSITPLLKNAIDWATRPAPGEPGLLCFRDKVAALLATSPGALGGIRGLVHVRAILSGLGVLVLPQQKAIPQGHQAFDDRGQLIDPDQAAAVRDIAHKLVTVTRQLHA